RALAVIDVCDDREVADERGFGRHGGDVGRTLGRAGEGIAHAVGRPDPGRKPERALRLLTRGALAPRSFAFGELLPPPPFGRARFARVVPHHFDASETPRASVRNYLRAFTRGPASVRVICPGSSCS